LLIPLLSNNPHHQHVASQYTAGIIPAVFVSLLSVLVWVERKGKLGTLLALMSGMVPLTLALNLAHSPLPLSVGFWNKSWSFGRYYYSNYLMSDHERVLLAAVQLIPDNPNVKVVIHSGIYHKNLLHRFKYDCFPHGIEDADYVITDDTRGFLFCDQRVRPEEYFGKVEELRTSGIFEIVFERDGVSVFGKKSGSAGIAPAGNLEQRWGRVGFVLSRC
jgi:hypothetical protein